MKIQQISFNEEDKNLVNVTVSKEDGTVHEINGFFTLEALLKVKEVN